jgi:hypothetical protein
MTNNFSRRQIIKAAGGFVAGATSVGGASLISNLFTPAQAQTEGTLVQIYTRGSTSSNWYLNGLTGARPAEVNLSTSVGGIYTGTRWRLFNERVNGVNYTGFKCEGQLEGPRWLDGLTREGKVNLAPSYGGNYTGTRWRVLDVTVNGNLVGSSIVCQGNAPGNRYLNGRTGTRTDVDLAPSVGGIFTGTIWKFRPLLE